MTNTQRQIVLLRGGGDLASGVALRLHRAGIAVLITEIAQPLAVRRTVSFSEAVYAGATTVEGITARHIKTVDELKICLDVGEIPVFVDPEVSIQNKIAPLVWVDARMTKREPAHGLDIAPLIIGLGPGFVPEKNCHAAIETIRGHNLGRVLWNQPPMPDTGIPETVQKYSIDRVLRAPCDGVLETRFQIGEKILQGQEIGRVRGEQTGLLIAPFDGVLRGLLPEGFAVRVGMKVGDLDPRGDPSYCFTVSDKALAIGGGVLEAILSRPAIRNQLWR